MNRPDASVYFLTAKEAMSLGDLINHHLSKVNAQKCISSGGVWHQGKRLTHPYDRIKPGQTIKVYQCPTQGYRYNFSDDFIIHETDDWVIVYKEPLITVAMDRSNMYFNLMAGLNEHYGYNDMQKGVQPITRLDYRVGGLCLFSKNKQSERRLFMLMQDRRIKKRYLAIVDKKNEVLERFMIKNHLSHKRKAFIDQSGKLAKTIFIHNDQVVENYRVYNAMTKTGRRHQVRFHASQSIGALVNDELYSNEYKDRHAPIGLIANQLKFTWRGKKVNIILPQHYIDHSINSLT